MGMMSLRRLRHGHAGGRRRRRHLPGRFRDPAPARRPAIGARGVVGSRRRRRPRRLRVPHGDHQRLRARPRRDGGDDRGGGLLVQAVHGLQGRADGARRRADRLHGAGAGPERADDGPRRERRHHRPAGHPGARRRRHVGALPRAHPPGVRRGRGDQPRRPDRRERRRAAVRRPRHLRGGGGRDRGGPAARRPGHRRDVRAVPDQRRRRPQPPRRRGLPLRLLAAAARRRQPGAAVGLRQARRAGEHLHRPLPVQRRAEGARPGELQPRSRTASR